MAKQPHRKVKTKTGEWRRCIDIERDIIRLANQRPTLSIKEIAKVAGVSENTVSQYAPGHAKKNIENRRSESENEDARLKEAILELWNREFSEQSSQNGFVHGCYWSTREICAEMKSRYGISPSKTRRLLAELRKDGLLYERGSDGKWPLKAWLPSPELLDQWEYDRRRRSDALRAPKDKEEISRSATIPNQK